ncbi:uncharacterized protein I206_100913 [Kwoniella pini CBS 10737]|uniref:Uncharacterized protein n=1 Tax=Kwoniella pini CBS 10737 TaxID=1296096 RepID=A0A1B9IBT4_9TREE|nr:uncharacterized protein I206_00413 [Kwoniella pini CBS 10737]OCF53112.1 hypothetical protein I206_00413 [Kwoniella pini CBS 10737]
MPIAIADLVQRSIVLTSVGLTIYGGALITHGIGYRALKAKGYFGGPDEDQKPIDTPTGFSSSPSQPS